MLRLKRRWDPSTGRPSPTCFGLRKALFVRVKGPNEAFPAYWRVDFGIWKGAFTITPLALGPVSSTADHLIVATFRVLTWQC